MSAAEAEAIVSEAEACGVTLIVHENFRFQPWYKELKGLLRGGSVGPCHSVTFRMRPGDGQGDPPAYVSRQPYFMHMPRCGSWPCPVNLVLAHLVPPEEWCYNTTYAPGF